MKYQITTYTVDDVLQNLKTKRFVINKDYQRNPGLWPKMAQSYFIDTILEGFPYPQIYMYQNFDRETKKPFSEIIDGQQRVTTLVAFVEEGLRLSKESKRYAGLTFGDLEEDVQNKFLSAPVETSLITQATRAEILEMFRRMNSYTLPLNSPEKRNARFQGSFKWFINDLSDKVSPYLENFGVLSAKKMLRLFDTELLSEFCFAMDAGVVTKSDRQLDDMFKRYDEEFSNSNEYAEKISSFFEMLATHLSSLKGSKIVLANTLHDLFIAATHLKYGIVGVRELTGVSPTGYYLRNAANAASALEKLDGAIELESEEEDVKEFVVACKRSTTKKPSRQTKVKFFLNALMS